MNLKIPQHIAIIMDGNGKWAKQKLLPKSLGHKHGADVAQQITLFAKEIGVKYLTLYAFSTENWQRSQSEIDYVMSLFKDYILSNLDTFSQKGIRLKFIGDLDKLSPDIQKLIKQAEENSKQHKFTLIIAISYGSRDEIKFAVKNFITDAYESNISLKDIDFDSFDQYLYTKDIPDPDLLIRTGGEYRISNFLLWQLSYSELYFTNKYWPDFNRQDLIEAITEFSKRERKYGK